MTLDISPTFTWNETVWNPSMLGPALWLDAADASTITLNGSTVSQWSDKSGNSRHLTQSNSALQPTYTTSALNAKNVVTFNGVDTQMLNAASGLLQSSPGFTSIAVSRRTSDSANQSLLFQILTSVGSTRFLLRYTGSGVGLGAGGRRLDTDAFAAINGAAYNSNYAINAAVVNYQSASIALYEQGVQTNSGSFQTPGLTGSGGGGIYLGSDSLGGSPHLGNIAELFITESVVSVQDRQKLEGYLAHKWGLDASLPADHPYKNYGPRP